MMVEVKKPASITMLSLLIISFILVPVLAYLVRDEDYGYGKYADAYAYVSRNFFNGVFYQVHHDWKFRPKASGTLSISYSGYPAEGGQATYAWTVTEISVLNPSTGKFELDCYALAYI